MSDGGSIAQLAWYIGEPARATMLLALLDGRSMTAGELARCAYVSPQAASNHLAKLVNGGLLEQTSQGRHRYYRLVGTDIAHALEALLAAAGHSKPQRFQPGPAERRLRMARTCYDHLAGSLAVQITEALQHRGLLKMRDKDFVVTPAGVRWFSEFGIDVASLQRQRRVFARVCLDWSERKHHVAGALGAALLLALRERAWIRTRRDSRAVTLTAAGATGLRKLLGIDFRNK